MKVRFFDKSYLLLFFRIAIGGLFIYSGYSKLINPIDLFQITINQYLLVPVEWSYGIALVVPWIELIFGTFLLLGYQQNISALLLTILTIGFLIFLGQAVIRRLPIGDCGCIPGHKKTITLYQSFLLDTILALALVQLFKDEQRKFSLDRIFRS